MELLNRFDFFGSVGKFERTQTGGIRVQARLTRTGVLPYRQPDGTIRRELRLPEEVFHADSLATLEDATVTTMAFHRGLIDAGTWKTATLGHARSARQDGKYVAATLVINDPEAAADIEAQRTDKYHDISCGYSCKLDMTPGVYEGERYDAIQRSIRYNHVAVLPKGRGRAGTDVALRLDAKDAVSVEADSNDDGEDVMKTMIRIDGKDLEYGSEAHISHIENAHKLEIDARDKKEKELQARCDAAEGAKSALETQLADAKKKADEAVALANTSSSDKLKSRLKLLHVAAARLDIGDNDNERMDALLAKDDRTIMVEVIRSDARYKENTFEGKSQDYVQAVFDSIKGDFVRSDGIDSVVETIERVKRVDASTEGDPAEKARASMIKDSHEAWTK